MKESTVKIAFVTEDGMTISQHFGRAPFYVIVTLANGEAVAYETRDKMGHAQFKDADTSQRKSSSQQTDARGHGFGADAQNRHFLMAQAIADCQVLVARGMGRGLYENMQQAGIRPIVTNIPGIQEAVHAYLNDALIDHSEKLH